MAIHESAEFVRHKEDCPECAATKSNESQYKRKFHPTLNTLTNIGNLFGRRRPRKPVNYADPSDLHPNDSPVVNSQVSDLHPGSVTVSQSTNHHPNGAPWQWNGRPDTNSNRPPNTKPFRPYPSRPHHTHFHPGRRPIVNSQVSDVHHDGSVTTSMESHEAPNSSLLPPYSSHSHHRPGSFFAQSHAGRRPIVNLQMTNGHLDGHRPIVSSQVTDV